MVIFNKIKPERYSEGSPERKYAEFVYAWQQRDFHAMAGCCQESFFNNHDAPQDVMFNYFGLYRINKLICIDPVEREDDLPDIFYDVKALIEFVFNKKKMRKRMTARLVKENGEWGVNPLSALRMAKA